MKMLQSLAFLFIVIFVMGSCTKDKYYNLDHTKWFSFSENDTLLYRNSMLIDTFLISTIINEYSVIDKDNYFEELKIYYKKCNKNGTVLNNEYSINRSYNATTLVWKNIFNTISYEESNPQIYKINEKIIEDVYKVLPNISNILSENDIKEVFYCDKYGIVAYKLENGLVYELDDSYISF